MKRIKWTRYVPFRLPRTHNVWRRSWIDELNGYRATLRRKGRQRYSDKVFRVAGLCSRSPRVIDHATRGCINCNGFNSKMNRQRTNQAVNHWTMSFQSVFLVKMSGKGCFERRKPEFPRVYSNALETAKVLNWLKISWMVGCILKNRAFKLWKKFAATSCFRYAVLRALLRTHECTDRSIF